MKVNMAIQANPAFDTPHDFSRVDDSPQNYNQSKNYCCYFSP